MLVWDKFKITFQNSKSTNFLSCLIRIESKPNLKATRRRCQLGFGDENYEITLDATGVNSFDIDINGQHVKGRIAQNGDGFDVEVDGVKKPIHTFKHENEFHLFR